MIYTPVIPNLSAKDGKLLWAPTKSIWFILCILVSLFFGYSTFSRTNALISFAITVLTLSFGHSVGVHRGFIHDSFVSSLSFKRFLIYLGTLTSLGGPLSLRYLHDLRDWAQRNKACHNYFSHYDNILQDFIIQMNCTIRLKERQSFQYQNLYSEDKFIRFLDKTWILQQIPLILVFQYLGGFGLVVWGVFVRVSTCTIGHWLVGHFAHKKGELYRVVPSACVQGYNVPFISILTMGESLHNNHHANPESCKFSIQKGELDPGWWCILFLVSLGWIQSVNLPQLDENLFLKEIPSRKIPI